MPYSRIMLSHQLMRSNLPKITVMDLPVRQSADQYSGHYEDRCKVRKDLTMARFTPATPRSRRLGRELRRLRDARGWTLDQAAAKIGCSPSRISRIESGDIKSRPGDVIEFLLAYDIALEGKPGTSLLSLARDLRQPGWWQRLDALSGRYATFIAYEAEAVELRNFEPTLVPGLLQTEDYARAINSVGRETGAAAIEQRVQVRLTRQALLTRKPTPLRLHTVLSEAALMCEVGGIDVLRTQLEHLARVATKPNVTVQVLRFAAGATLADRGGFAVLSFDDGEPSLGYVETPAGELLLESPQEVDRLTADYDHLRSLAMSPAESVRFIRDRVRR